jgi:hypothetical protein
VRRFLILDHQLFCPWFAILHFCELFNCLFVNFLYWAWALFLAQRSMHARLTFAGTILHLFEVFFFRFRFFIHSLAIPSFSEFKWKNESNHIQFIKRIEVIIDDWFTTHQSVTRSHYWSFLFLHYMLRICVKIFGCAEQVKQDVENHVTVLL